MLLALGIAQRATCRVWLWRVNKHVDLPRLVEWLGGHAAGGRGDDWQYRHDKGEREIDVGGEEDLHLPVAMELFDGEGGERQNEVRMNFDRLWGPGGGGSPEGEGEEGGERTLLGIPWGREVEEFLEEVVALIHTHTMSYYYLGRKTKGESRTDYPNQEQGGWGFPA